MEERAMNRNNTKRAGILMITGGGIGTFFWLIVSVLGTLFSMRPYPGGDGNPDSLASAVIIVLVASLVGAILELITGIMVVGSKSAKKRVALAIISAILCLPGSVIILAFSSGSIMVPLVAILGILLGVVPQIIYLVKRNG